MNSLQTSQENSVEISNHGKKRKALAVTLCVILILSLVLGWSPLNQISATPFQNTLSHKMSQVTVVMGATIALGVVVDAIPVVNADQLAGKLFDVAGYLMVVLGAIIAMKILLTVSLQFSFGIIIPFACLLASWALFRDDKVFMVIAKKLAIFAIVFAIAIPASVLITMTIDSAFEADRDQLVEQMQQGEEIIDAASNELQGENAELESLETSSSNGSVLDNVRGFAGNIVSGIAERVASLKGAIADKLNGALETAQKALEDVILHTVQWIVTTCAVPIVTLIGFGFVIKILFGFDINPALGRAAKAVSGKTSSAAKNFGREEESKTKNSIE